MFSIRRYLHTCALAAAVWLTAACGNEAPAPTTPSASAAGNSSDEKPTYVVITQSSHPPFSIRNSDGSMGGLDVELLQAVAQAEGLKLQIMPHNLSGMLDTLQSGHADIATGIQITPEHQNTFIFSQPYLESGYGFLLPSSSKINNVNELQGKVLAVTSGGTVEKQLRSINISDKILPTATLYLGLKEVKQDNAAAVYGTEAALKPYLQQNPDFVFIPDEKSGQIQFAFALEQRGAPLRGKINDGLNTLRANGTYQKIINKWLHSAHSVNASASSHSSAPH